MGATIHPKVLCRGHDSWRIVMGKPAQGDLSVDEGGGRCGLGLMSTHRWFRQEPGAMRVAFLHRNLGENPDASMTLAATIVDDSANLSALTANNIRAVHILRLPFRLRLGMFHRFRYDDNTELFFRNHVDLPAGSTPLDAVRHPLLQGKDYESLFTEAMIIVRNLPLDIQTVAAIAEQLKQDRTKAVRCDHKSFAALKALNDFIVAYHTVTKTLFGGTPLGRLSDIEFFDRLLWEDYYLISPAETDEHNYRGRPTASQYAVSSYLYEAWWPA